MTRKEWIEKNLPAYIDDRADGGVIGCPNWYHELTRMDPSIVLNWPCKGCHEMTPFVCELCWNTKLNVKEEKRTTMGEPHIGDTFYTIVPIALGKYQLYIVGEFIINLMSSINDRQVRCSAFDDRLAYQYTFFYDLVDKKISFNYEVQRQAKNTPNLDRSLFLDRGDAIEALDKWTGNVIDKSYYFLKQKGE